MDDQTPAPQNGQIVLRIIGETFTPNSHSVSTHITDIFKERQCRGGYTWKHVDAEMKEFYYKEFLKKYTWESGEEIRFKITWNLYCKKQYKELLYKWRKKESKPTHVTDDVWESWQRIWTAEKWQQNSIAARNNRNSEVAGVGIGVTKHTAGSRSIVEHAIHMEETLQRPSDAWELFRSTHTRKDGTFVDTRSQNINDDMTARFAQASQPAREGEDPHVPSHEDINEMYYEVVGGPKKSSLYGLGSQAKIIYDSQLGHPKFKGCSKSSAKFQAIEEENEALRARITTVEKSIQDILAHFELSRSSAGPSTFPAGQTPHGFDSQETQDPGAPNE